MHPRTILFLLLLCACSLAGAQQDDLKTRLQSLKDGESLTANGVTITMHRRAAGAQRSDGWVEASSTGCGFGVLVPGPYNDFSQTAPTKDGTRLNFHIVGTSTAEGAKFTAICLSRDDNKLPPDWATSTLESIAKSLEVHHKGPVSASGLSGFELTAASTTGSHLMARFLNGDQPGQAFQLMVEFPASEASYMPAVAQRFLDSFQPPRKPTGRQ